jgi:hypothetical protein
MKGSEAHRVSHIPSAAHHIKRPVHALVHVEALHLDLRAEHTQGVRVECQTALNSKRPVHTLVHVKALHLDLRAEHTQGVRVECQTAFNIKRPVHTLVHIEALRLDLHSGWHVKNLHSSGA